MRKYGMMFALILMVTAAVLMTGCQKPPEQELAGAQQAIDAAKQAEAEKYAQSELSGAQSTLDQARAEIETQKAKWFPNYDNAKKTLEQAKTQGDQTKEAAIQGKEKAKQAAMQAIADAKTAVEAAGTALKSAPKGKGTKADLELMTTDLQGYTTAIGEAEQLMASEDFTGATAKATGAKDGANKVAADVAAAIEAKMSKGGKKK